jgi:GntR family transcriptional repressor for pyruvate dehydrogenase complex
MSAQDYSREQVTFRTIERGSTLVTRVTKEIERSILEGRLQPGDRLPPERDLAHQFGVSRTVIRETMHRLQAKSLLEARPGGGTIVRSPSAQAVAQSMTMLLRAGQLEFDYRKVLEIRLLLEVEVAGLAAERRTPADLEELEEILHEAPEIQDDRDAFAECDVEFHAALASATHNELFSVMLDSLADIMLKMRQMAFDVPGMVRHSYHYHSAILEQVRAGDVEGARRAMREHLMKAEDTMAKVWAHLEAQKD